MFHDTYLPKKIQAYFVIIFFNQSLQRRRRRSVKKKHVHTAGKDVFLCVKSRGTEQFIGVYYGYYKVLL
jgi:hypothetical protein